MAARCTLAILAVVVLAIVAPALATQDDELLSAASRIVSRAHDQLPALKELNNQVEAEEHDFDVANHEQAVVDEQVAEANVQAMNLMETQAQATPAKPSAAPAKPSSTPAKKPASTPAKSTHDVVKNAVHKAVDAVQHKQQDSKSSKSSKSEHHDSKHKTSKPHKSGHHDKSGRHRSGHHTVHPWVVDGQQYDNSHIHYHYPQSFDDENYHIASHPYEVSLHHSVIGSFPTSTGRVFHHHHHHYHRVPVDTERRIIRAAKETLSKLDRKYVQLKHAMNALDLARTHINHEIRRYQARRVWRRAEAERWRQVKEREEDSVEAEEERRRKWRHELELRREEIQMDRWYRHHAQALNSRYLHHHHHHHYANGKRIFSHSSPYRYESKDKLDEAFRSTKPAASAKLNRLITKIKKAVLSSLPKAGAAPSPAAASIAAIGKKSSFRALEKSAVDTEAQAAASTEAEQSTELDLNELAATETEQSKIDFNNIMAEHQVAHNMKDGVEYTE